MQCPDGTQADHVLCDRSGRPMAALEAKRAGTNPIAAQDQGCHDTGQLNVPLVFPVETARRCGSRIVRRTRTRA